jgi:hypothetical protein
LQHKTTNVACRGRGARLAAAYNRLQLAMQPMLGVRHACKVQRSPAGQRAAASRHAVWIQMSSRARHGDSWPAHIHTHAHMHTHTYHTYTHAHTRTAAQACSDARAGLAHVPYGDVLHSSSPDQLCRQVPVLTGTQTHTDALMVTGGRDHRENYHYFRDDGRRNNNFRDGGTMPGVHADLPPSPFRLERSDRALPCVDGHSKRTLHAICAGCAAGRRRSDAATCCYPHSVHCAAGALLGVIGTYE